VQSKLLQRALEALRPGGTLVYSTCTISKRENEERIDAEYSVQLRPDRDRTTGFFIGRTKRDDGGG
jgi:16S rRNA (cytosine967-C5)-methyltransferase